MFTLFYSKIAESMFFRFSGELIFQLNNLNSLASNDNKFQFHLLYRCKMGNIVLEAMCELMMSEMTLIEA